MNEALADDRLLFGADGQGPQAWSVAEIAPWAVGSPSVQDTADELRKLHETNRHFFLFRVHGGGVTVLGKPAEAANFTGDDLQRAKSYGAFLEKVAATRGFADISLLLGMGMDDKGFGSDRPVNFAFQKTQRSMTLLLPDIDLLRGRFYCDDAFVDELAYSEKSDSAIFCGSTTGADNSLDVVRNLATPRLQAAAYFRGHPFVHFYLPRIVQCSSSEAIAALREMGLGDGRHFSWHDQFKHKFIISLDGNGATCSRVAIALRSNSVLLKYDSNYELYYFKGLQPWIHYIPIRNHSDIEEIVISERRRPGLFEPIARNGREFADRYLTERAGVQYTAALLRRYGSIFMNLNEAIGDLPRVEPYFQTPSWDDALIRNIRVRAHVGDRGDVFGGAAEYVGRIGSGKSIQGFDLTGRNGERIRLEYCAVGADGSATEWVSSPDFCGSRGQSRPIYGFAMRFSANEGTAFRISYSGTFTDGSSVGPVAQGKFCRSAALAPLEAMSVVIERVPNAV